MSPWFDTFFFHCHICSKPPIANGPTFLQGKIVGDCWQGDVYWIKSFTELNVWTESKLNKVIFSILNNYQRKSKCILHLLNKKSNWIKINLVWYTCWLIRLSATRIDSQIYSPRLKRALSKLWFGTPFGNMYAIWDDSDCNNILGMA